MNPWSDALRADSLPWLLSRDEPAARHATLLTLLDRDPADPEVIDAASAASAAPPIAAILAAQHPDGWWVKPGPGYAPKYTGTTWQVIFLDQLCAPAGDSRVQRGVEYILAHSQAETGGFAVSGRASQQRPSPHLAIHCLHGNLLRAVIGFGRIDDERVARAIDWQARSVTGDGFDHYFKSGTSGPGFQCAANEGEPCAWGAVKATLALGRIPIERRSPEVNAAICQGRDFLLSRNPADADYPMGWGNAKPNASWFKLGFPVGYVSDVLQTLEVLCAVGAAKDPRLTPAVEWLLAQQDETGRWRNRYAYAGKMQIDVDRPGEISRWVTLRACRVLKDVLG